ncbi:MAG: hypothetical protein JO132_00250 [Streptosporangiaceae bacterium]|nr:hypothetical protein [Streptosporangiaceae bacterium]
MPGVTVSGTVTVTGTGETEQVTAVLRAQAPGLPATTVDGSWRLYGGTAQAAVTVSNSTGRASGSMPAPQGVPY